MFNNSSNMSTPKRRKNLPFLYLIAVHGNFISICVSNCQKQSDDICNSQLTPNYYVPFTVFSKRIQGVKNHLVSFYLPDNLFQNDKNMYCRLIVQSLQFRAFDVFHLMMTVANITLINLDLLTLMLMNSLKIRGIFGGAVFTIKISALPRIRASGSLIESL